MGFNNGYDSGYSDAIDDVKAGRVQGLGPAAEGGSEESSGGSTHGDHGAGTSLGSGASRKQLYLLGAYAQAVAKPDPNDEDHDIDVELVSPSPEAWSSRSGDVDCANYLGLAALATSAGVVECTGGETTRLGDASYGGSAVNLRPAEPAGGWREGDILLVNTHLDGTVDVTMAFLQIDGTPADTDFWLGYAAAYSNYTWAFKRTASGWSRGELLTGL